MKPTQFNWTHEGMEIRDVGQYYLVEDVDPLLEQKDKEIERWKSEIGGLENTINIISTPRIVELEQENATLQKQLAAYNRMVVHQDKKLAEFGIPKSFLDNFGKETI